MITGTHAIIYADDAGKARAFFRDVLGWPNIEHQGFGLLARLRVPGAGEIGLYQPRHTTAYDLPD
jgi:catechol 2,3-dioxygenase-like lactoylglutathione lyase family enzyme